MTDADDQRLDTDDDPDGTRNQTERRRALTPLANLMATAPVKREPWTAEERSRVMDELVFEDDRRGPFIARFLRLTVASAAIAAFGLLTDSAAVVIGAMLVAPLMVPILGTAAAIVHGNLRRLSESLALLLGGTVAAICVGWLVAKVGAGGVTDDLTVQLLQRTSPGLLDLGIAIAAGSAAAYILTDRGAVSALPGVAIAVALVPPLATAGVTLEIGELADTEGALLLFSTNLVAIVLSAATVFVLSGFVEGRVRAAARGRVRLGLAVTAMLVVAVAIPLGFHTRGEVEDEHFQRSVTEAIDDWDPDADIIDLKTDRSGDAATIDLIVASATVPVPAFKLAELVSERESISSVTVYLSHRSEVKDEGTTRN